MTLTEFVTYCRQRLNAVGDTYWSDAEIWGLISSRTNQALGVIGYIEGTDTSTSTVASTQAYDWPSDCAAIVSLLYNGKRLQEITFREWESEKNNGTTPTGEPEKYVNWNRQVLLVPTPDAANTLTFYYEKMFTLIDSAVDTVDFPAVLHDALADGVIADMFAKSQNQRMAEFYESKWAGHMKVTFPTYKYRQKNRGRVKILIDADSSPSTSNGVS